MKLPQFATLLAALAFLVACTPPNPEAVAANDSRYTYEGRIDFSNTTTPKIVWQGTRITINFEGDSLLLEFSELQGQVYFDITLDGETQILKATDGITPFPITSSNPTHSLTLTKRSEASAGTIRFHGITAFNPQAKKNQHPEPKNQKTYLFFGDSITAGACNEDGEVDQWNNRSTHNANLSYGALTAKAMNARYRNISVSGMGVSMGYTPFTFPEIWNRYEPNPDSPIADLASYQPDTLFINLGENDDSFSQNNNPSGFPKDYSSRYIAMVREMRTTYPKSKIVILRGGMYGGSQSLRLRGPWGIVVETLEASDENLTHYVFKNWSRNHPRVDEHQIMANELINWLKSQS